MMIVFDEVKIMILPLPNKLDFKYVCSHFSIGPVELYQHVSDGTIQAYIRNLTIPINVSKERKEEILNAGKNEVDKRPQGINGFNPIGNHFEYKKDECIFLYDILLGHDIKINWVKPSDDKSTIHISINIKGADIINLMSSENNSIDKQRINPEWGVELLFDDDQIYFKKDDIESLLDQNPTKKKNKKLKGEINNLKLIIENLEAELKAQINKNKALEIEPKKNNRLAFQYESEGLNALYDLIEENYFDEYSKPIYEIKMLPQKKVLESSWLTGRTLQEADTIVTSRKRKGANEK